MKQFFKAHAIWIGLLAVLLGCMLYPSQADAKTKTYQTQDNYYGGGSCSAVISKNKVYYSVTETGKIFCYDIKTKKTKTNLHDIMNSKHIRRQAYSDGEG